MPLQELFEARTRCLVAIASGRFQAFAVQHFHGTAAVLDPAFVLQRAVTVTRFRGARPACWPWCLA